MTDAGAAAQNPLKALVMSLLQGGLSYLRWTQMVPMVLGWAFALFVMLAALFVGNQEQGFALLIQLTETFPGLTEKLRLALEDSDAITESDGMRKISSESVTPWILRIWGIIAALLMVFGWVKQKFYPTTSEPYSLRRKLGIAMGASVITVGIMMVGGVAAGAVVSESVLPALLYVTLLFLVSAYSLTVSHIIGSVQRSWD